MNMRYCPNCHEHKPPKAFGKGRRVYCTQCRDELGIVSYCPKRNVSSRIAERRCKRCGLEFADHQDLWAESGLCASCDLEAEGRTPQFYEKLNEVSQLLQEQRMAGVR